MSDAPFSIYNTKKLLDRYKYIKKYKKIRKIMETNKRKM